MSKRPDYRAKPVRILGMLGSEHDNQALAAARKAEEIREAAGLTWQDIVSPERARNDGWDDLRRRAASTASRARARASAEEARRTTEAASRQPEPEPTEEQKQRMREQELRNAEAMAASLERAGAAWNAMSPEERADRLRHWEEHEKKQAA